MMEKNMDNDELDQNMKLPLTDKRYRLPGLNAFSLSKWSRENEPKNPPRFNVDDIVTITVTTRVAKVYEDCDGTPLYALDCGINGVPDGSHIRKPTDEELNNSPY